MEKQNLLAMSKKELKEKAKALRSELDSMGGIPPYIDLRCADENRLILFLRQCEEEINEQILNNEKEKLINAQALLQEEKTRKETPNIIEIGQNSKTLNDLGKEMVTLSDKAQFIGWQFKTWTKNGTLRIYVDDISYKRPKQRGYYLISEFGDVEEHESSRESLPTLPIIKKDYINDLVKKDSSDGWEWIGTGWAKTLPSGEQIYKGNVNERDRIDYEG